MKKLFTLILVLALMLVPASALADTTYFEDDFESYPADIGFMPPVFVSAGVGDYVTEVRTQNGSNMLYMSSEAITGTPSDVMVQAPFTIDPGETQLVLSFTFMSDLADDFIGLVFGVPDSYIIPIVFADGSIGDDLGNPILAPPGTVQPGVYYDVKIVMNLVGNTVDIYIDNTLLTSGLPLVTTGLDVGNLLLFISEDFNESNSLIASVYIDNILLTGERAAPAEPAENPRTGDSGSYGFLYVLVAVLAMVFVGFMVIQKAAANEE